MFLRVNELIFTTAPKTKLLQKYEKAKGDKLRAIPKSVTVTVRRTECIYVH